MRTGGWGCRENVSRLSPGWMDSASRLGHRTTVLNNQQAFTFYLSEEDAIFYGMLETHCFWRTSDDWPLWEGIKN